MSQPWQAQTEGTRSDLQSLVIRGQNQLSKVE